MAITAAMVKELREMTGAGMMDCKKALTESDGDFDKAVEYLREKGLAAAAKKAANQYRKTRSLLMKLAAEPGEDAQAQALDAVAAYTQTFNKMGFIETEKRDEIYMALRGILDALPDGTLQKDALMEKFEQLRDF